MKVTLKDITTKDVKTLYTCSEVYLCMCINYCLKVLTNNTYTLDTSNVALDKRIWHTAYIADAIADGLKFKQQSTAQKLMTTVPYSNTTKKVAIGEYLQAERYADVNAARDPKGLFDIKFEKGEDDVATIVATSSVTRAFGTNESMRNIDAWVYVVAMFLTLRMLTGQEQNLIILDDGVVQHTEFVHILICNLMGNKLLDVLKLKIITPSDNYKAQRWSAMVIEKRQRGYMLPEQIYKYTVADKQRWFTANNIGVGSVLLRYTRVSSNNAITTNGAVDCIPCVVNAITEDKLVVQCIETLHTKATVIETVTQYIEEGNTLYTNADKYKFASSRKQYALESIGIDACTNNEEEIFMLIPEGAVETYEEILTDKEGDKHTYTMDDVDLLYAVLCDQGVSFDKEQYKEFYYKPYGKEPLYDVVCG